MSELISRIKGYISEGYENFEQLDSEHQYNLISTQIGIDDADWIFDKNLFASIKAALAHENYGGYVMDAIRSATRRYYADHIREQYDYVASRIQTDKNLENGLRPFIDAINGEVRWFKP